ncbi:MAG: hypothetical protein JXA60_02140 [Candidatus Coatesbacteria bacterium]|nr:hypothetical protein [Candidatus Coatesbacteria bacterium]
MSKKQKTNIKIMEDEGNKLQQADITMNENFDWDDILKGIMKLNPALIITKNRSTEEESEENPDDPHIISKQISNPQERYLALILLLNKILIEFDNGDKSRGDLVEEIINIASKVDIKKDIIKEWVFLTIRNLMKHGYLSSIKLLYHNSLYLTTSLILEYFQSYKDIKNLKDFAFILSHFDEILKRESYADALLRNICICSSFSFQLGLSRLSKSYLKKAIDILKNENVQSVSELAYTAAFVGEYKLADELISKFGKTEDQYVTKGMALSLARTGDEASFIPLLNQIGDLRDRVDILKIYISQKKDLSEIEDIIDSYCPGQFKSSLFMSVLENRSNYESVSPHLETLEKWIDTCISLQIKIHLKCHLSLLYYHLKDFTKADKIMKENIPLIDKISFHPDHLRAKCEQTLTLFKQGAGDPEILNQIEAEMKMISYKPDLFRILGYFIYTMILIRKAQESIDMFARCVKQNIGVNHTPGLVNLLSSFSIYAHNLKKEDLYIKMISFAYKLAKEQKSEIHKIRCLAYITFTMIKTQKKEQAMDLLKKIDSMSSLLKDPNDKYVLKTYKARLLAELGQWKYAFQEVERIGSQFFRNRAMGELINIIIEQEDYELYSLVFTHVYQDSLKVSLLRYWVNKTRNLRELDDINRIVSRMRKGQLNFTARAYVAKRYIQLGYEEKGMSIFNEIISSAKEVLVLTSKTSGLVGITNALAEAKKFQEIEAIIPLIENNHYFYQTLAGMAASYPENSEERTMYTEKLRDYIANCHEFNDLKEIYAFSFQSFLQNDKKYTREMQSIVEMAYAIDDEGKRLKILQEFSSILDRYTSIDKLDKSLIKLGKRFLLDFAMDKPYFFRTSKNLSRIIYNIDKNEIIGFMENFNKIFIPELPVG